MREPADQEPKPILTPKVIFSVFFSSNPWPCSVVIITTAKLHLTKPELRFCAGSYLTCSITEICNGENLSQFSQLEIRLKAFRRSTISQKSLLSSYNSLKRLFELIEAFQISFLLTVIKNSYYENSEFSFFHQIGYIN